MNGRDRWDERSMAGEPERRPGRPHAPVRLINAINRMYAVQWGDEKQNFCRLYPNPGVQFHALGRRWHWCRMCWSKHHRVAYKVRGG